MVYNNPDSYPGESEQEYEDRTREEVQASSGVFSMLVTIFGFALKLIALFGIFFYAGFLLAQKIVTEETDKLQLWGLSMFFTYLIFCIVYFLKGTIIGLRAGKRMLWILPWGICVLICCIAPGFIVKSFVAAMFNFSERESIWCIVLSWGAFLLSSLYLYGIYQFKTPTAPKLLHWSYVLGLRIAS